MDLKKVSCLLFFSFLAATLPCEDYKIQKGDSLVTLTQKFGVSAESWKSLDPERDWSTLTTGETLKLPTRHSVISGDTLYSLAKSWGVEVADIRALNGLETGTALKIGAMLWVPAPQSSEPKGYWPVSGKPKSDSGRLKAVSFPVSGANFLSVTDGTVVFSGEYRGVGKVILVESPAKVVFGYGNFENALLKWGDKVAKGQVLGKTSSRVTERLSFFVSKDGEPLDPAKVARE
jgi:LysM repeat protein